METGALVIWSLGLAVYAVFMGWYHNWRGALKPHEIDAYMRALQLNPQIDDEKKILFEKFMREDTGREFLMLNLLRFHGGELTHPVSGQKMRAMQLLQDYFRPFIAQIMKRGGHLAYTGRVQSGYIEDWGVAPDPGWQMAGLIRYRSRRDLMEAIVNPKFGDIHMFKHAALEATMALPLENISAMMVSPRIWVGLLLIGVCGVAHLVYLLV